MLGTHKFYSRACTRSIIIIIIIIIDTHKRQFIMCKSCGKNALGLPYEIINEFGYGSHRQGELCLGPYHLQEFV